MSEHHTLPAERHVVHVESVAAVQSSRLTAIVARESGEDPPRLGQPEKRLGHEFDFQQ